MTDETDYSAIGEVIATAMQAVYALKNHTHSGYASSTHSHGNLSNIGELTASPSTVGGVVVTDNKSDKICVTSKLPYSKISGTPTIPSKVSDLQNDSGFITSSAISGMLTSSDIADNLTTNDATKVLSAKQGKALKDLIGDAITYINQ